MSEQKGEGRSAAVRKYEHAFRWYGQLMARRAAGVLARFAGVY